MAYKSKRTRDLQGEVKAGTNVSVQETTKPDGTKVYEINSEAPIGLNQVGKCQFYFTTENYDGEICNYINGGTDNPENTFFPQNREFYEIIETNYNFGLNKIYGLKIKKSGIYLISFYKGCNISTSQDIDYIELELFLINDNSATTQQIYNGALYKVGEGGFNAVWNVSTLIQAEENEVISFFIKKDATEVSSIDGYGEDSFLSIVKIR